MCVLEVMGAPSTLRFTRKAALARMFPILDLSWEENTARRQPEAGHEERNESFGRKKEEQEKTWSEPTSTEPSANGRRSLKLKPGHSPPKRELRQSATGFDRKRVKSRLSSIGEGSGKMAQRTHPTKRRGRHL